MLVKRNAIADQYNFKFTRGSTAYDSRGRLYFPNNARFERGGISIEEGTTNLLPAGTENFVTGGWGASSGATVTVTPNQPDPFGGNNAYRIQSTGGTGYTKYVLGVNNLTNPHTIISSVWMKVLSGGVYLYCIAGGSALKTTSTWEKVTASNTYSTTSDNFRFTTQNIGDSLDILVYQPMMQLGSYPTSYIPPGQIRAAEVLTVDTNDGIMRKNMLPPLNQWEAYNGGFNIIGEYACDITTTDNSSNKYMRVYVPCVVGKQYNLSLDPSSTRSALSYTSAYFYYTDINKSRLTSQNLVATIAPASAAYIEVILHSTGYTGYQKYVNPQIEEGNARTSFQTYGARLAPTEGTIEILCRIDATTKRQISGIFPWLFNIAHASNGTYSLGLRHSDSGATWDLVTKNDSATASLAQASDSYTPDGNHIFTIAYTATSAILYIDGIARATINTPNLSTAFGISYIGAYLGGALQINTMFYDACFSSIKRTDADIQTRAAYAQANGRFPDDQYVTWHANFDRPDAVRALRSIVL